MANINLRLATNATSTNIRSALVNAPKNQREFFKAIAQVMSENTLGMQIQLEAGDAVAASGTVTFGATATANDTIIVNGVTFTAKASGATGDEFNIGASATASALNLATAISASSTALVSGVVKATNVAGVVTITALKSGVDGNLITIAEGVDGGTVISVSGARLTAGADDSANYLSINAIKSL